MTETVWITGASSGIGEALAQAFAKKGDRLILSARREAELERVRSGLISEGAAPDDIYVLPFDMLDYAAYDTVLEKALSFHGGPSFLINNAGISQRSLAVDTSMETYRTLMEIDVFAQIALTKALLPHFVEKGAGHFMIIASVAGKVGVPYRTGYCAAKHAVMGYFDALRAELAHKGIRVTTVTPGFIQTNIAQNALMGDGSRFDQVDKNIAEGMEVNECARQIMQGLAKGKKEIAVAKWNEKRALILKRFLPNLVFDVVAKMGAPR